MIASFGLFRTSVMKLVSPKSAKLGLRVTAQNTIRTNTAQAIVLLRCSVGNLNQALEQYILGLPMSPEDKANSRYYLGDIAQQLALITRYLKLKTPASTSKVKLSGTRTLALLQLDSLTNDMLSHVAEGLFGTPVLETVKKMVTIPATGKQEERDVQVVDKDAEAAVYAKRAHGLAVLTTDVLTLFWALCLDITGETPAVIMAQKLERLHADFPNVQLDLTKLKEPAPKTPKPTPAPAPVPATPPPATPAPAAPGGLLAEVPPAQAPAAPQTLKDKMAAKPAATKKAAAPTPAKATA